MSDPQPHGRHGLVRRVRGGAERGLRPEEALDADTVVLREFQKSTYLFPKKIYKSNFYFLFSKCWEPGNRWALEQAKHNLVNKYFLVGLTEELEAFIQMLEITLPK